MRSRDKILGLLRRLWNPQPAPPGPSARQVLDLFRWGRMPDGTHFVNASQDVQSSVANPLVNMAWVHLPTNQTWTCQLDLSPQSLLMTDWAMEHLKFVGACYATLPPELAFSRN